MTTYSYDRENRLISQNVDGNVTSFAYDGFGRKRRESRGVNPDVILNWDGDQMIVESSDLDPEAPSKAYYVADGVIYAENANLGSEKSRRDYAVDYLGSVTGLTETDGSLSSVRRWSAYGKLLSGSAEPIGYFWTGNTGSRVYQSLGLNDNRARHYGRNIKQWITRDPLWPSELPYAYVSGNPVTRIDPSGLLESCYKCPGCNPPRKCIFNGPTGSESDPAFWHCVGVGNKPIRRKGKESALSLGCYDDMLSCIDRSAAFGESHTSDKTNALGHCMTACCVKRERPGCMWYWNGRESKWIFGDLGSCMDIANNEVGYGCAGGAKSCYVCCLANISKLSWDKPKPQNWPPKCGPSHTGGSNAPPTFKPKPGEQAPPGSNVGTPTNPVFV